MWGTGLLLPQSCFPELGSEVEVFILCRTGKVTLTDLIQPNIAPYIAEWLLEADDTCNRAMVAVLTSWQTSRSESVELGYCTQC